VISPPAPIAGLSNSYARLPERFFARLDPTPVPKPRLIQINRALATQLGLKLDGLDDDTLAALFAGNLLLPGAEPIATVYAGHQFGHFVPQLGDGRAILLGEVRDCEGERRELQLKGSGRTPFSRNGDGRAALGPVLREYLVSEAMHALGIPSTRALAAVMSGERIRRDGSVPGAVFTRVAASHIRVGTFQYFASRGDVESTRRLADYVIDRHYPHAAGGERPYVTLLQSFIARQAALIAHWMHVGFIHGVMNTDNMALSGETIDFGPCAFLDTYDPEKVFSSIDESGRYAYANQPHAAHWNLARFAETLLPILDPSPERAVELANKAISAFSTQFAAQWLTGMLGKLGAVHPEDGDRELVQALLDGMQQNQADFTLTFRALCDVVESPGAKAKLRALFANPGACDEWLVQWESRLSREPREAGVRAAAMRHVNPAFIPRNHRIEQAIAAATEREDFSIFTELLTVLSRPYEEQEAMSAYAKPPLPEERVLRTFCGT
jgi:serine/tyrosine/threonine adenylyltransferase